MESIGVNAKSISYDLAGRTLVLQTGVLANQATGSAIVSLGDTVLLATATMAETPREDADFFPLLVDYEERFYAAGKIKGSRFIKREGRPSDNAILIARLIDRPLRPLFPKGMQNDVQIIITTLSADLEVNPDTTGIIAASFALLASGIPFEGPIAAVRVGLIIDSEAKEVFVLNPTYEQCEKGKLDIVVAGTSDAITMVEGAAKEVSEEKLVEALEFAHGHIKKLCALQEKFKSLISQKEVQYAIKPEPTAEKEALGNWISEKILDSLSSKTKAQFHDKREALQKQMIEQFSKEILDGSLVKKNLTEALDEMIEKHMRRNILEKEKRIDGRKPDEIRQLWAAVSILPRTHGSGLFTRGETQVISLTTLGAPGKAQIIDIMDSDTIKRYMHHYNFPPFSTGEVKPLRGTSRRETGHGDLVERALLCVLPSKEEFPYAIRVVSEVLSCNGSSSMASVCGSTLSLMDAGVKIKRPVAGIAMGLITDSDKPVTQGGPYKILADIQGLEDFAGDMDFKVAGTEQGITALQMDIKVKGITTALMKEALLRAKKARGEVLKAMLAAISAPRENLSPYAPLIISIRVLPEQIRDVIGPRGETIQKITAETGCEIDIEDDGLVNITAPNQENGQKAFKWIQQIVYIPKIGDEFEGKVTRIMDFGAFVEFVPGKEGLVHISQLENRRVNRVEDAVKIGDTVKVKLMEIDEQGRYNLSRKACLPMPKQYRSKEV